MSRSIAFFIALLTAASASAAQPKPQTLAEFNAYVQRAETRIAAEQSSPHRFLRIDTLPVTEQAAAHRRLRSGDVLVESLGGSSIPHGLIHDWVGTAFLPGATLAETLARVQDYDHLARYFRPEVISSRLLAHAGDEYRMSMRLRRHQVVTVVLDTDYDVRYGQVDAAHWFSQSRSTRIREIADAGTPGEHALPPADEHGFLWQLNSYWRFVQAADGVYIQCEAISLTRDIPAGLGWLVSPFVRSIPRESLQFTLEATRRAVLSRIPQPSSSIARSDHDQH